MPDTTSLVTKDNCKVYLQIAVTTYDTLITALILSASKVIEGYIGRKLVSQSYTEYYDGTNEVWLHLQQFPITTLTSVKLYDYPNQTIVYTYTANTEYIAYLDEGMLYMSANWNWGKKNFQIVYTAGHTTIPEDIQLACSMLVGIYFNSADKSNISAERIGGYSVNFKDLEEKGIPENIRAMLNPYRKLAG